MSGATSESLGADKTSSSSSMVVSIYRRSKPTNPYTMTFVLASGLAALLYTCCHENRSGNHNQNAMPTSMSTTIATNNDSYTAPFSYLFFRPTSSTTEREDTEQARRVDSVSHNTASENEDNNNDNNNDNNKERHHHKRQRVRSLLLGDNETEQSLIDGISSKLQPVQLQFEDEKVPKVIKDAFGRVTDHSSTEYQLALKPHQFLHLHHMKTGGTSVDHMLQCAMKRLEKEANYAVPYYSIHECSRTRFARCLSNSTDNCRSSMDSASIMSYCSALKYLDTFGWWNYGNSVENFPDPADRIKAFTVLRHPVDRVWSMFRFQTKNCYKCSNLTEIYDLIDQNKTDGWDALCLAQLQNHEVANLLSSDWSEYSGEGGFVTEVGNSDVADAMIEEAILNMKSFFTVVGLTEEIVETARILGVVFPWLNTTLEIDVEVEQQDASGNNITTTVKQTAKTACPLPHDNSSPQNNRCIEHGQGQPSTHWDLPKHPDEATRAAIEKHNAMDMQLYEAAVQYFELQRRAIESGEGSYRH